MKRIEYWLFESWISLVALLAGVVLVLHNVATNQVDIVDKIIIFVIFIIYFVEQLLNKIESNGSNSKT